MLKSTFIFTSHYFQDLIMKKLTCPLLLAFAILGSILFPVETKAEKGEKSLGISGGYATYNNSGFANLFFQYSFTDHIRLAPEVGYVFRNEDKSAFEISTDLHFPFRIAKAVNVYPLVGLTYQNWHNYSGDNLSQFGGDFGGGFELYLTPNLKLNLEGKYSWLKRTSGGFFDLGVAYIF